MKGILGQKIGMTSMFSEQGTSIPVTIIKTLSNVVTNVLTTQKNGYDALQLSAFERRPKTVSRPVLGHFKKANTNPKYFTREIRNMTGFNLGDKVDLSIFKAGELVDVTSNSKGKGFSGAIKRHNQKIGPRSHGGGGGSKPVRLTGGSGDVASNRVFKGRHMPGQMGSVRRTIQNLEIILVDQENEALLVKGSVPGPRKCFVVVREAIKGLAAKEPTKLIDISVAKLKNKLVEEATKVGAEVNTSMDLQEMQKLVSAAQKLQQKDMPEEDGKSAQKDKVKRSPKTSVSKITPKQEQKPSSAPKASLVTSDNKKQELTATTISKQEAKPSGDPKKLGKLEPQPDRKAGAKKHNNDLKNDTKTNDVKKQKPLHKPAPKKPLQARKQELQPKPKSKVNNSGKKGDK